MFLSKSYYILIKILSITYYIFIQILFIACYISISIFLYASNILNIKITIIVEILLAKKYYIYQKLKFFITNFKKDLNK